MSAAGSLNHLRLSVRDPAASERFYDPVLSELGWVQEFHPRRRPSVGAPRHGRGRAVAHPDAGRRQAPCTRRRTTSSLPGFHHLALNAADRDQVHRVHDVLLELGADILDPPAEYDYDPGYYAVFCRDPDGFKLEVVHLP